MQFDRCTMYKYHISSPIEFVPLRSSYTSRIQVQHILNYIEPRAFTIFNNPQASKEILCFPSYQKMSEVSGTSYAYMCFFPIPPYTAPGLVVWEVWVTRFSFKLLADGKLLESWGGRGWCCILQWCLGGGATYYLLGLHLSEAGMISRSKIF